MREWNTNSWNGTVVFIFSFRFEKILNARNESIVKKQPEKSLIAFVLL